MLTTDGEACRNKVMVDFSSAESSPIAATARGAARGSLSDALLTHESLNSTVAIAAIAKTAQTQTQAERRLRLSLELICDMRSSQIFLDHSLRFASLYR